MATCCCGSTTCADGDVTTQVEFPVLSVSAAKLGTVFEEGQVTLPVQGSSVAVNPKGGETRALALQLMPKGASC